jgi:hypothetical protein
MKKLVVKRMIWVILLVNIAVNCQQKEHLVATIGALQVGSQAV